MPNQAVPDADQSARPRDLQRAGAWLARHGLADAKPTPLLTRRLAARQRARLIDSILLAVLFIVAALTQARNLLASSGFPGLDPDGRVPLLILTVLVVGLLLGQWLLDWWLRRVDRRAGAALSRRVAHPIRPGWEAVLGRPHAAFTVASFAVAAALGASALTVQGAIVRYAAAVLLIGLVGVGIGRLVRLRHVLARPVVAEDEASLTADFIMRVEDARELTSPAVAWALPMVLVFGTAPAWWNAAAIVFVLAGVVTLVAVHARSPRSGTVARQAMCVR